MSSTHEMGTLSSVPSDRVRLAWPPPGLEPIHDALWPITRLYLVGAALFTAPLLLALADESPYWSLGPFGQSWWIPIVTSVLAFVLLLAASIRLAQLLRGCARGARLDYSGSVMAAVAADRRRDSGFVIQAARSYAALSERDRTLLIRTRTFGPLLYLFAAMWAPLALVIMATFGYAGLVSPRALLLVTLVPAAGALVPGLIANAVESLMYVRTQRAASNVEIAHELRTEASAWNANLQLLTNADTFRARAMSPRALNWASAIVVVPALLLLLPRAVLTGLIALGPLLATIAVPNLGSVQTKHATVAVLRPYRIAADPAVTAADAGTAMHNLTSVGSPDPSPLQRPFTRSYDPWLTPGAEPLGNPAMWASTLFDRVRAGLTAQEREYLARVAAHPAHGEYEILARAAAADIAGARYLTPLPDTIAAYALPIPRFSGIRLGAYAHIGKAAHELANGDAARAEQTVREVISAGLLLADHGPTLIDALIGITIADAAGLALEKLYRATGRSADADRLQLMRSVATQTSEAGRAHVIGPGVGRWLRQMPAVVTDTTMLRGLRWEMYTTFNSLSRCINLHQAVFGRDEQYRTWLTQAEQALVRHPGDRDLFAVGRRGWMPRSNTSDNRCDISPSLLRALLH